jgi:ABC-type nitrate/sulfonate/bicarbonate transport system permease component
MAMRVTNMVRRLEPLVGIVAVVVLWALVARIAANSTLVPSPAIVWQAFVAMLDGDLPRDILASLAHLGVGYGLGAMAGLALALAAGSSRWLEAVLDPLADSCARSARSPGSRSRSSCSAWAGWFRSS